MGPLGISILQSEMGPCGLSHNMQSICIWVLTVTLICSYHMGSLCDLRWLSIWLSSTAYLICGSLEMLSWWPLHLLHFLCLYKAFLNLFKEKTWLILSKHAYTKHAKLYLVLLRKWLENLSSKISMFKYHLSALSIFLISLMLDWSHITVLHMPWCWGTGRYKQRRKT